MQSWVNVKVQYLGHVISKEGIGGPQKDCNNYQVAYS